MRGYFGSDYYDWLDDWLEVQHLKSKVSVYSVIPRPTEDVALWAIENKLDLDERMFFDDSPPPRDSTRKCEHCQRDKLKTAFNIVHETWGVHYAWWCKACQEEFGGKWGVDRYSQQARRKRGRIAKWAA